MSSQPSADALGLYDDFLAKTGADRLQKILARYELFKLTLDVPGDIVECGVFRGSSLYTWAKLHLIYRPRNERRIVGFDFFEMEREAEHKHAVDQTEVDYHATRWSAQDQIRENMARIGFSNIELVAGNVVETTRKFAEANLGCRISLLHLDLDGYESTLGALKALYPLVSPGGVVIFDEYAYAGYGESDAVDEFFRGQSMRLRSLPWANTPTAYLVKEAF